jgi:hypothetical protein
MAEFYLVVRGGDVATGYGVVRCDIGVQAALGSGRSLARGPYDMVKPRSVLADGFDAPSPG